jgi:hypothetical protein
VRPQPVKCTRTVLLSLALALVCTAGLARADLKTALAERDLGKRSKLALENANAALKATRAAYQNGDLGAVKAGAQEVVESVDLAWDSLESTGKNPRKSPRWFKNAEIQTRDLLKKLETLQRDMGFEDRPILDKSRVRIQEIHDQLLTGLMEGKSK